MEEERNEDLQALLETQARMREEKEMSFHESELQKCRNFLLRLASWCSSHISSDTHLSLSEKNKQVQIDRIDTILQMLLVLSDIQEERVKK